MSCPSSYLVKNTITPCSPISGSSSSNCAFNSYSLMATLAQTSESTSFDYVMKSDFPISRSCHLKLTTDAYLFRPLPRRTSLWVQIISSSISKSLNQTRTMKRRAESTELTARKAAKGNRYCSVEPKRDSLGNQIWPAPENQMIAARAFLREW
jgi:hypothetical protein